MPMLSRIAGDLVRSCGFAQLHDGSISAPSNFGRSETASETHIRVLKFGMAVVEHGSLKLFVEDTSA